MERITADHIEEYEAFLAAHPKGHFMQSVKWGKVKTAWRQEILVRRDAEGRIAGSLALLIRKVPGMPWTMMYCPRGPVCDYDDRDTLMGILYCDYYVRASKRPGAWMTDYRSEKYVDGVRRIPVVSLTTNFPKPVGDTPPMLSIDDVKTYC